MPSRTINEVLTLPDEAIISSGEAAAVMNRHVETLRRWRRANFGPQWLKHPARPDVAEYQIGDVRRWLLARQVDRAG